MMPSRWHSIAFAVQVVVSAIFLSLTIACHRPLPSWRDVATGSGCTPELLARTAAYDSTRVLDLIGSYRLVQVDTTRGWIELERHNGSPGTAIPLRLWATDSTHRRWRRNPMTGKLVPANRPIVGILAGYEEKGFSPENPQVVVTSPALDYLTITFTLQPMFDGTLWEFPIQRLGSWGFGGFFYDAEYVVPAGVDGKPLDQRAGFYCAFRD